MPAVAAEWVAWIRVTRRADDIGQAADWSEQNTFPLFRSSRRVGHQFHVHIGVNAETGPGPVLDDALYVLRVPVSERAGPNAARVKRVNISRPIRISFQVMKAIPFL